MYNADGMKSINETDRVLAIDWGGRRIGVAISDETRTLARPLLVLTALSRIENAKKIAEIAVKHSAGQIIIGVTYDQSGNLTPSGRRADRLAQVLEAQTDCVVRRYDETHSTQTAKNTQITLGASRKKRAGHLDAQAAAVILQTFLDEESKHG